MLLRALRRGIAAGVVAGLVGGAAPAAADHVLAQFVGQSEFVTMEGGDVVTSWFDARNVGTGTWEQSNVRLGTANPRGRASVFYDPDHWINPGRATPLDQPTVAPGQIGRFTFKMHAPRVTAPVIHDESFEPLWELHAWMGGTAAWPHVWLRYTVIPAAPPAVTITSVPAKVIRGEPIVVVADASDNLEVAEVRIQGVPATAIAGTRSYRAELDSTALPPGVHAVTVRATDRGGRVTEVGSSVEVAEPAAVTPATPPARPAIFSARISSVFVWKGGRTRFTSVRIADLPPTARAQVTCKGRGCPAKRRTIRHKGGTVNVLRKLGRLRLRAGAVLQVRLADAGAIKLARWKIRAGKAPTMTFRCAPPGGRLSRCP